jgi:D-aspartate ligase
MLQEKGHQPGRNPLPTAFVLNVSLAGLGAIRSLGRAGVPVVGLDPAPTHAGFKSRYCDARVCPHPVREPEQLFAHLIEEAQRLDQPGILSPASDAFVLFISRNREALAPYFRFNLPSPDVVEAAIDKRKLYEMADEVGVAHAHTEYPTTMDEIHRIKDDLDYPVYIKPYHSHLWQLAFPGTGKGIKAFSPAELERGFERVLAAGQEAMVQEIIQGPASNIQSVRAYIREDGEVLAAMANRKIRQFPSEFGRATLAQSFHDPEFLEMGLKFFRDIEFRGFGLIEFKRDERDGVLKATDLNPRWLKSVNMGLAAGINFPLLHYQDLAGMNPDPQMAYRDGVYWLETIGDLATAWSMLRAGEVSPLQLGRKWLGVRGHAVFAMDDWGPFLREYQYGKRLLRAPISMWKRR